MSGIKPGDAVELKAGSVKLVVIKIEGEMAICERLFDGGRADYPLSGLKTHEPGPRQIRAVNDYDPLDWNR